MSDVMLLGVLGMSVEMIEDSPLALRQYVDRGHEAVARILEDEKKLELATKMCDSYASENQRLSDEIERLKAIIHTPHTDEFMSAVNIEAEFQQQKWDSSHDGGKDVPDWFWLLGYLAGKATRSLIQGDTEKGLHHIITTAAACKNWFAHVKGQGTMRPGIEPPEDGNGQVQALRAEPRDNLPDNQGD